MVRTPLRVSLFGGGTDYPAYFRRRGGAVIGFAINKYIYLSALKLGASVDYRFRLSYSRVETADRAGDLVHPVVGRLLGHYGYDDPTDFSIQADLPSSAGLGSSSAFTVGMVALVSALQRTQRTKLEIAREAIFIEQDLLGENVGVQDQLHASFGGINRFNLSADGFDVQPVRIAARDVAALTDAMVLVFTGIKRRATEIVGEQIARARSGATDNELAQMMAIVDEAHETLERGDTGARIEGLGRLLDRSWQLKRQLSSAISNDDIDALYRECIRNGAIGGKLCGAGGGGFLLMVVPRERRAAFCEALGARRCVDFGVDFDGATILHNRK